MSLESLDITVRFVIPRSLILEEYTDEQVALDVVGDLNKEYGLDGIQIHLAEISSGLII